MPPAATTSGQALQGMQNFAGSMLTPQAAADQANKQYGVDAAQGQVQGLRGAIQNTTDLLNKVAPSVMGRVGNSLVTDAQANRQITNEQAPLNTQLNTETTDYSNANTDYHAAVGT